MLVEEQVAPDRGDFAVELYAEHQALAPDFLDERGLRHIVLEVFAYLQGVVDELL